MRRLLEGGVYSRYICLQHCNYSRMIHLVILYTGVCSLHSYLLQHEQWQRMSIQPGAELTIEYILYNQTITYMDSTIFILDPQNRIVAQ